MIIQLIIILINFFQQTNIFEDSNGDEEDESNFMGNEETETIILTTEEAPRQKMFIAPKRAHSPPAKTEMPAEKKTIVEDSRIEHAYSILKDSLAKKAARDKNNVFAEYVALKLKGYSNQTRNIVEHQISNILFEADMGNFDRESDLQT